MKDLCAAVGIRMVNFIQTDEVQEFSRLSRWHKEVRLPEIGEMSFARSDIVGNRMSIRIR